MDRPPATRRRLSAWPTTRRGPPTKEELQNLFDHLERALDQSGFLRHKADAASMVLNLRALLQRAEMTEQEARTFHGVIKFLSKRQARGIAMSTTAKISWVDGALLVAEGGSGHTITMDGAPDIGGRNLASRPMEVLLMGMGGCTAIDVVSMLKKQRQDIEGVEVSLVAERPRTIPRSTPR